MPQSGPIACPSCFANYGFRQIVTKHCDEPAGPCPRCKTAAVRLLSVDGLRSAMNEFFVEGSYVSGTYASLYQINNRNPYPATFDASLDVDARLASYLTGTVVFNYGPPLWRLGRTNHYHQFEAKGESQKKAAASIIAATPKIKLDPDTLLYRIRLNPKTDESITTPAAFDSPPDKVKKVFGRWDDAGKPVLYVADDIELCLHECRATIADEIVVATVAPSSSLRLADLSQKIELTGATPFDDANYFVSIMCWERAERWLSYCRALSAAALAAGYDGIRYKSYYSQAKSSSRSLNLAIFGYPLSDGRLKVVSINRLRIADLTYQYKVGPVLYRPTAEG